MKNLNGYNMKKPSKGQWQKSALLVDDAEAKVCAGCGDSNPEYILDDRHLCFDCYRAEKYYWAKGTDTHL